MMDRIRLKLYVTTLLGAVIGSLVTQIGTIAGTGILLNQARREMEAAGELGHSIGGEFFVTVIPMTLLMILAGLIFAAVYTIFFSKIKNGRIWAFLLCLLIYEGTYLILSVVLFMPTLFLSYYVPHLLFDL